MNELFPPFFLFFHMLEKIKDNYWRKIYELQKNDDYVIDYVIFLFLPHCCILIEKVQFIGRINELYGRMNFFFKYIYIYIYIKVQSSEQLSENFSHSMCISHPI